MMTFWWQYKFKKLKQLHSRTGFWLILFSHFSLSCFLVTNLHIFKDTTCNSSFFKRKVFPIKATTLNTTCVRIEQNITSRTQTYIFTVRGWLSTNGVRTNSFAARSGVRYLRSHCCKTTPTVTATIIVTNISFQLSNVSLFYALVFLKYTKLRFIMWY
jgi:hypothetical protein